MINVNDYGGHPYLAYANYLRSQGIPTPSDFQIMNFDSDFQDAATQWFLSNGGANPYQGVSASPTAPVFGGGTEDQQAAFDQSVSDYQTAAQQLPSGYGFVGGGLQSVKDESLIQRFTAPDGNTYLVTPQDNYNVRTDTGLDAVIETLANVAPLALPSLLVPGFGLASAFGSTESGFALQDAINLAGQGLNAEQIAQVLEVAGNSAETASTIAQVATTVAPVVNTASAAYSAVADPINSAVNSVTGTVKDTLAGLMPEYQAPYDPEMPSGFQQSYYAPRRSFGGVGVGVDPDAAMIAQQSGLPESYWNMTADAGASSVGQLGSNSNFADTFSPDPFAEQAAPGFSYDLNIPSLDTYTGTGGNVGFFDDLLNTVAGDPLPGFDANGNFSLGTGVTGDMSTVTNAIGDTVTERDLADILTGGGSNLGPLSDVLTGTAGAVGLGTAKTAYDYVKQLFGGEGDVAKNLLGAITSPLKEGGGSLLSVAPSIAAINYARNQTPFDTGALQSVFTNAGTTGNTQFNTGNLQSLYNTDLSSTLDTSKMNDIYSGLQGNQSAFIKSLTNPYDEQTAMARGRLTQSLGNRGVLGSSFGNFDLTSYDAARDRGRADVVAQGMNNQLGLQTNVASNLMNAQNQDRAYGLNTFNAKAGLANNMLGAQQAQAQLGLAAQGLQNTAANNLLNAQIKERELRNNLYGSALNALAGGLAPKNNFIFGSAR